MGNKILKLPSLLKEVNPDNDAEINKLVHIICAQLERIFSIYDNDGSNSISLSEWSTMYVAIRELEGKEEEQAKLEAAKIFKQRDLDGNGVLTFEEFRADAFQKNFFDKTAHEKKVWQERKAAQDKKDKKDGQEIAELPDWRLTLLEAMAVTVRSAYRKVLKGEVNPHANVDVWNAFKAARSAVLQVFRIYDTDGKGLLSMEEWIKANTQMWHLLNPTVEGECPPEYLASSMKKFAARDMNQDNSLTFDEFETDAINRYFLAPANKYLKENKHEVDNGWRVAHINKMGLDYRVVAQELKKALGKDADGKDSKDGKDGKDAPAAAPAAAPASAASGTPAL